MVIYNKKIMRNEIIILEKKYWDAMANHDFETVKELTFFPCIVAGKKGVRSIDEDTFATMFEQSKNDTIKAVDISNEQVSIVSEDYVVLGYNIRMEYTTKGQTMKLDCVCTSAWVRIDGRWQCPLHTETEIER